MAARLPTLNVRLTGTPSLHIAGEAIAPLRHRKGYALVYYLAATRKPATRSELTKLLWGDLPEEHGRNNLRVVLTDLRKKLGVYLDVRRSAIALQDDASVRVDLHAFRDWARNDAPYGRVEGSDTWQGPFLDGFDVQGSAAFNAWAFNVRDEVREEAQRAFIYAAEAAERDGRDGDVVAMLRRSLDTTPWDESTHRRLIDHLASRGQYAAARMQFEACRRALELHLGIAPDRETLDTLERALRTPTAPQDAAPQSTGGRWPLHGRDEQRAALAAQLRDPTLSLISVVGLPGMGRSHLVREVLREEARHLPATVVNVSLHDARSDDAVWQRVGAALDAVPLEATETQPAENPSEDPPAPNTEACDETHGDRFQAVQAAIGNHAILLVLDDVEPDVTIRAQVASLVTSCPNLRVVHVAQRPFGSLQERTIVVPPLPEPELDTPDTTAELEAREPTVALLLEVARRADATFTVPDEQAADLARLARDIGGHPVALMLAGRRLPTESIASLLARWCDPELGILHAQDGSVDPLGRHGSLAETFEPILRQVTGTPRRLLGALAVFRTFVPLTAIAEVAGVSEDVVERVMETFVRERWVMRREALDGVTVRLIPTLAAVVAALDVEAGDAEALRDAHAGWFLRWSETLDADLTGPDQARALAASTGAADDFERAIRYLAHRKPLPAIQLLTRTWRLATRAGRAEEAYAGLHGLLETHGKSLDPLLLGDACNAAGALAYFSNRRGEARRYYERSLDVRRSLGDAERIAGSLMNLATLHHFREAYDEALTCIEEASSLLDEREEPWLVAALRVNQGHILAAADDVDGALAAYRAGALLFEEVGDVDATWAGRLGCLRLYADRSDAGATRQELDELEGAIEGRVVSDPSGLHPTVAFVIDMVDEAGLRPEAQRLRDLWNAQRDVAQTAFPSMATSQA